MTTTATGDWMPELSELRMTTRRRDGWALQPLDVGDSITFDTADVFDRHGFSDGDLLNGLSWAFATLLGGRRAVTYLSGHALLWYVWHHLVVPAAHGVQPAVAYYPTLHNPVCAVAGSEAPVPEMVTVTTKAIVELAETAFAGRGPGWVAMFDEVYNSIRLANWGTTFAYVEKLRDTWEDWQLLLAVELFDTGRFGPRLTDEAVAEALNTTLLVTSHDHATAMPIAPTTTLSSIDGIWTAD